MDVASTRTDYRRDARRYQRKLDRIVAEMTADGDYSDEELTALRLRVDALQGSIESLGK